MSKESGDVRHCNHCGTRTWHYDNRCEWSDGHSVYLREVDPGTPTACYVVCAKGDLGAVQFIPA